jgi:DNA modification methylase
VVAPYLDDGDFRLYHGDARVVLPDLPTSSVHAVLTSPPFWNLRDYAAEGQLGLEDDPGAYVENLRDVFAEVARILRPDGTLWVEVGDTLRGKRLQGIPWRLAFALQADGWIWRNVVIWNRPNPMPESARDRLTVAHSYVLLFARRRRYYFDGDAIREPAEWSRWGDHTNPKYGDGETGRAGWIPNRSKDDLLREFGGENGTRNARTVWTIPTEPLREEHYAAFPQQLAERVIRAATSELGACETCGAPWERVVQRLHETGSDEDRQHAQRRLRATGGAIDGGTEHSSLGAGAWGYRTVGWRPTCNCGGGIVPCWVLDPFIGSGTTALVARRLGRCCVGVELSSDYCEVIARRTPQLTLALGVNE